MTDQLIKRVNLGKTGLELFMGPTEALVMSILWDRPCSPTRLVVECNNLGIALAYNTLITVTKRMERKGWIKRITKAQHGRPQIFTPVLTQHEFIDLAIQTIVNILDVEYPVQLKDAFENIQELNDALIRSKHDDA